jgi:Tol biopolymer transport system component
LALVFLALADSARATSPGANGKIAYSSTTGSSTSPRDVLTINPNGTGLTNLIGVSNFFCDDRSPTWSRDGTKIAWAKEFDNGSFCTGDYDIWIMNADGNSKAAIPAASTPGPSETQPTLSPDGTKVAFVRGGDIWSASLTGGAGTAVNLTNSAVAEDAPAWSPDGTTIAYQLDSGGGDSGWDIYWMNADGTNPTKLVYVSPPQNERRPNWNGDGSKIVFDAEPPQEVYTVNYYLGSGSGIQSRFTGGQEAAWSPDGFSIAMSFNNHIWTNTTGQVTTDPNRFDFEPDWQPLASPYETPFRTQPISVGLTPVFRQCGTGGNPANTTHGAPDIPGGTNPDQSCTPPVPTGTARMGLQSVGTATITEGAQPDILLLSSITDVTTAGGADYNPVAAGPDLTMIEKLRITDTLNGASQTTPGTVTDLDFATPIDCTPTASTVVGSTCYINTSVNALVPGLVKAGKRAVINVFRVRINDAGPDNVRGNADDKLFLMQGLFTP